MPNLSPPTSSLFTPRISLNLLTNFCVSTMSMLRASLLSRLASNTHRRTFATSANRTFGASEAQKPRSTHVKGDYVPVCMTLGLIGLALAFGGHTAMQQLRYGPNVQVSKKKREKVPEVEEPDYVTGEADKFMKNSFFRKVAHVQEFEKERTVPDNIRSDVYTRQPKVETLKSVGVEPASH